ncbi:hypothetical protein BVRB_9g214740 [Beta vulgaris subsp. vulgaris]|nr:hypothetical protein BVRB_9g214740 [Beta vulgaris subsp. vulgaris]
MDSREKEDALSLTQKALKAQSEDCSGTLPGNAPGSADDAGKKTPDKPQPTHLQTTTSTTKLIHPPVKSFKEVTSMNCTGDAEISLMEMMPFPTWEKKRYAAMCVLMEKAKPLPTGAWIGKNFQQLVFCEGPGYCDVCQNYGHQARHCGQSKNFINAPEQRNVTQKIDGENDREEGQWAEVNRRGGKNNFGLGPRKDMTQLKRWTPKKSTEKVGIKENTKKPEDKNVEREKEAPNVIEKGESSCTISNSFISLQELGDLEGVISEHTQTKVPQEVKGGKPTQPISPKPSHQSPRSLHKTPQGKSCSLSPNKNFQNFTTKKPTPQKNGGPSGDFSHLASASLPTKLTTISTVSAKNLGDQIRPSCPLQSTSQTGDGRIQPGLRGLSNSGGGGGILHRPNMEGSEGNNDQPLPEAGDISKHDTGIAQEI